LPTQRFGAIIIREFSDELRTYSYLGE
jgi:hypothetical protein